MASGLIPVVSALAASVKTSGPSKRAEGALALVSAAHRACRSASRRSFGMDAADTRFRQPHCWSSRKMAQAWARSKPLPSFRVASVTILRFRFSTTQPLIRSSSATSMR